LNRLIKHKDEENMKKFECSNCGYETEIEEESNRALKFSLIAISISCFALGYVIRGIL